MTTTTTTRPARAVRYAVGDATLPPGDGPRVIAHVCNDVGAWGRGFVVPLGDKYPAAKTRFLAWHRGELTDDPMFALGGAQLVPVGERLWVANMVGQHGLKTKAGVPPIRLGAIAAALADVAAFAARTDASIHMPRIGCGLAGGTWDEVGPVVERAAAAAGVRVVVYDLPPDHAGPTAAAAGTRRRRRRE
jgi:hypothetical protein